MQVENSAKWDFIGIYKITYAYIHLRTYNIRRNALLENCNQV